MSLLLVVRILAFLLGLEVVRRVLLSAVEFFILPRGVSVVQARAVFLTVRRLFDLRIARARNYWAADAIMALYAPMALLALIGVWLLGVILGYSLMFWSTGLLNPVRAFTVSGSSLFTLGFATGNGLFQTVLTFSEASIGLLLVALVISYLPAMYSAWSRRERAVARLQSRAGTPPSPVQMIVRLFVIGSLDNLSSAWSDWEDWFLDIEESHTSLAALAFFRSPQPELSWVTTAGAVLDFAALAASTLDRPREGRAELTMRTGYLALRRIAVLFQLPFDPDPSPTDPISVTRHQFDMAYDRFEQVGVPIKPDRDQCWRDFAGWRVNYDAVLAALARLTMAPPYTWLDKLGTDHYFDIVKVFQTGHDVDENEVLPSGV